MKEIFLWGFVFTIWFIMTWTIIRNGSVHVLGMEILGKINILCAIDEANKMSWKWRYRYFGSVSYNTMMLKFWLPVKVESFYKDLSFLEPQQPLPPSVDRPYPFTTH